MKEKRRACDSNAHQGAGGTDKGPIPTPVVSCFSMGKKEYGFHQARKTSGAPVRVFVDRGLHSALVSTVEGVGKGGGGEANQPERGDRMAVKEAARAHVQGGERR